MYQNSLGEILFENPPNLKRMYKFINVLPPSNFAVYDNCCYFLCYWLWSNQWCHDESAYMWHTLLQQLLQCCSVFAVITQLCLTESTFIEAIVAIIVETSKITIMAVYNVQQAHQKWIFKNGAKSNNGF